MSWELILLACAVLACPAMMYFMMRRGSHASHDNAGGPPEDARDREIRALKGRLEEVESRAGSEERSR